MEKVYAMTELATTNGLVGYSLVVASNAFYETFVSCQWLDQKYDIHGEKRFCVGIGGACYQEDNGMIWFQQVPLQSFAGLYTILPIGVLFNKFHII